LEEVAVSLDHLLLWLSAKGQGSWPQFRGAVEELCAEQEYGSADADDEGERPAKTSSDLPIYQRARFALQRLAHVEFFSNQVSQDWRVVPPTVALLPSEPGKGLLCGARSPDILERLNHVGDIEVVRAAIPGIPERILIRGSSEAVALAAARLGLLVQVDAPMAILSAVPGVRDPATWAWTAIPETPGWAVHRFSPSRLGWGESSRSDAWNARTGLFRFVMGHQRFYYLRWRGCSYRVPVQVGKYAIMPRRRGLLAYDMASQMLSVPAVCRPPLLIERALVLCSGLLPSLDWSSGRLEYTNVPPDVARLAAQLLRQEIAG
jgi:hypothetical protein